MYGRKYFCPYILNFVLNPQVLNRIASNKNLRKASDFKYLICVEDILEYFETESSLLSPLKVLVHLKFNSQNHALIFYFLMSPFQR